MVCHSHNPIRSSAWGFVLAAAGVLLAGAGRLSAQTFVTPAWPVPPPVVWIAPAQPVTTYYLPAGELVAPPASTVTLPAETPLQITVAESLLSKLMARQVATSGPIRDCLLGADLIGNQFTVTQLSIDCVPCPTQARVLIRLTGSVTDHTVGVTRPARIQSEGSHQFQMSKQVDFDGRQLTTRSPEAWVTPHITYRGATTIVSGVPVIGQIGTAIAMSEAERRRPAVEQFALRRVTREAAPRFNNEVDEKLSKANGRLSAHSPAFFERLGLSSADQFLATGDDRLFYGLRIPASAARIWLEPQEPSIPQPSDFDGPVFLEGLEETSTEGIESTSIQAINETGDRLDRSAPPAVEGRSVTILIHEDFVNHVLHTLPLHGREVPDRLIDQLMEGLLDTLDRMSLEGLSIDLSNVPEPEFATILLHQERPLSIRFEDGQAVLTALAGFRPQLPGEVPTQRIEIPFRLSPGGNDVTLEPGEVTVSALPGDDNSPLAGLARPVIRQQVEKRLQPITIPRTVPVAIPKLTPVTLSVRDVVLADGWLAITLD